MHELEKYFGIKFNNIDLLNTALTHSSYANENNCESNERLEFIGDAVVDLLTGEYLYKNLDEDEGVLTKKRANIVCEKSLAYFMSLFNLDKYLLLGKGEEKQGGRERETVRGDAFEAFIGAVYLDQGIDACKKIMDKVVFPNLEYAYTETIDYKSELQEVLQAEKESVKYEVIKETGEQHNKTFTSQVVVIGMGVFGVGTGKSKLESEQNAARQALDKLAVTK